MSTFAIVSRIDHLPRLLSDLAGLSRLQPAHGATGIIRLAGVWIEQRPDREVSALVLPDRLASGPLRVVTPLELSAIWAVCTTDRPDVSRGQLIDAILEATRGTAARHEGRFIPVFDDVQSLAHRHLEWQALNIRYPGIVLPPLAQLGSGVITVQPLSDPFLAPRLDDRADTRHPM